MPFFFSALFAQDNQGSQQDVVVVVEEEEVETEAEKTPNTVDPFDIYNVYQDKFFPTVAVASFTGPSIVSEFSFNQDNTGQVTATGAFQKGLQ